MAEVLKIFQEGEDILASETNANNNYLLGKISDNASTLQNYVEGEITSIQSSLASAQATLQNSINEITSKLGVVLDGLAPNLSAGIGISSGYTTPSIGWVYAYRTGDNFTASLKVDDRDFLVDGSHGGYSNLISGSTFFVGEGVKITFDRYSCTFYPCKGVKNA